MDITPRKRAKIVTLSDHTTMSQRKIAESVGVNLGSVRSIFKKKKRNRKCSSPKKSKVWKEKKYYQT